MVNDNYYAPENGTADRTQEAAERCMGLTRVVKRNAPCPCGSGRKFKRCCLLGLNRDLTVLTRAARDSG